MCIAAIQAHADRLLVTAAGLAGRPLLVARMRLRVGTNSSRLGIALYGTRDTACIHRCVCLLALATSSGCTTHAISAPTSHISIDNAVTTQHAGGIANCTSSCAYSTRPAHLSLAPASCRKFFFRRYRDAIAVEGNISFHAPFPRHEYISLASTWRAPGSRMPTIPFVSLPWPSNDIVAWQEPGVQLSLDARQVLSRCDSSTPEACASRRTSNVLSARPRRVSVEQVTVCSLRHICTRTGSKPSGCGCAPLSCVASASPSFKSVALALQCRDLPLSQEIKARQKFARGHVQGRCGYHTSCDMVKGPKLPDAYETAVALSVHCCYGTVVDVKLFLTQHGLLSASLSTASSIQPDASLRARAPVAISGACVQRR